MPLYVGSNKIKELGDYGVYYGSTPIEKIYNGSQLVYEWKPYNPNTVFYNNGNVGAVTWSASLHKGIYSLSLAGGGNAANNGYYYWPAGNKGSVLVCTFKLAQKSTISVTLGAGGAAYGGKGGNTVFSINGTTAITCPGGGGAITINSSVINILSTTTNNTGGGGGGSGSNPTTLSPWGDGGYTYSAAGRGGGMRLEWLRLK